MSGYSKSQRNSTEPKEVDVAPIGSKNNNNKMTPSMQDRIQALVDKLCDGMYEREEIVAVALLGAMCGHNSFLYGPPGTAKSLIARRIACAFETTGYFEYLMNRFSTPDEVFGPVSIKELKEDRYIRKADSYLPTADFAFLDEIWKSSPAILNTLLTLLNERIYRNGTLTEKVPLKAVVAASNETPESGQGLDALYDRFTIRLLLGPLQSTDNFESLLTKKATEAKVSIPNELLVKEDEWGSWQSVAQDVQLSKETLTIIRLIKHKLTERYEALEVYVSDRRWQRAAMLMKAAAFFNDRKETNHSDAVLLQHCLWTGNENLEEVQSIVADAIKQAGFESGFNLATLDREKDKLDKEINKELYHSKDIYENVKINGKKYYQGLARSEDDEDIENRKVFIPVTRMKSRESFHPVDERLQDIEDITANFDGQGCCTLEYEDGYGNHYRFNHNNGKPTICKIRVLFHKGDKKQDINQRLIEGFKQSIVDLRKKFESSLEEVQTRFKNYEDELRSPFVPIEKAHIALEGISDQITSLQLRLKDCDRLEELCR